MYHAASFTCIYMYIYVLLQYDVEPTSNMYSLKGTQTMQASLALVCTSIYKCIHTCTCRKLFHKHTHSATAWNTPKWRARHGKAATIKLQAVFLPLHTTYMYMIVHVFLVFVELQILNLMEPPHYLSCRGQGVPLLQGSVQVCILYCHCYHNYMTPNWYTTHGQALICKAFRLGEGHPSHVCTFELYTYSTHPRSHLGRANM
jgi:hypothetical protein